MVQFCYNFLANQLSLLFLAIVLPIASMAGQVFIDDDLKSLNLDPKVIEIAPIVDQLTLAGKRSKKPMIDLDFGKLTEKQFRGLSSYYRNRSKVPFNPKRDYLLSDFLTPQMQALLGNDFESQNTKRKIYGLKAWAFNENSSDLLAAPYILFSTAQCWGTTWNNIASLQGDERIVMPFDIALPDTDLVEKYLYSNDYSLELGKNQNPKYGDIFAIQAVFDHVIEVPMHFPMYIGFGLVFEKEDSNVGNPYQIVSLEESKRNVRETVDRVYRHTNRRDIVVRTRRFLDVGKPSLPKISRAKRFWSKDTSQFFGRTAAGMIIVRGSGQGGAIVIDAEYITKVRFDISEAGRGVLRKNVEHLFSPAFQEYKDFSIEFHG